MSDETNLMSVMALVGKYSQSQKDEFKTAFLLLVRKHAQARKDALDTAKDLLRRSRSENDLYSNNHRRIVASAAYDAIETLRCEIELMVLQERTESHDNG